MKIVVKDMGSEKYLVYLKDDNNNSLVCYEYVNDEAGRHNKVIYLMEKYDVSADRIEYITLDVEDVATYTPTTDYPLVLVFYLDRELMENPQIIQPYAESVNAVIAARKANMVAFFLPTDGEERIECINPKQVSPADMAKINTMVEDISKQFNVGDDLEIDLPSDEELGDDGYVR